VPSLQADPKRRYRLSRQKLVNLRPWVLLVTAFLSVSAFAQVGRGFVTIESHVGSSQFVYLGRIVRLEAVPPSERSSFPAYERQYRLSFKVTEAVRGPRVASTEFVISVQRLTNLQYFRDHATELLLIASTAPGDENYVQGAGDLRYSFRILQPLPDNENAIAGQINTDLDSGRMFGVDLVLLGSRSEILRRARAFTRKHPEVTSTLWLQVPNDFARRCGYPNAFAVLSLPVCPETARTLVSLLRSPDQVTRFVSPKDRLISRSWLVREVLRQLEPFPTKEAVAAVRKLARSNVVSDVREAPYASQTDIEASATALLKRWNQ
jgi:hypothetical protein